MLPLSEVLQQLPSLKLVVDAHGLMAQKALGQNFLLDQNITDKIIRLSLKFQEKNNYKGSRVFEVGSGPGGLTRAVLKEEPDKLTIVEMDPRCISIMEEIKEKVGERIEILNADALKVKIESFEGEEKHIVSNLPYNISVPLLTMWLENIKSFKSLTLMFQKEVAERICAPTNTKAYGRLSVLAQLQCRIDKLLDLPPECFVPAPKIWSSVLLFRPLEDPLSAEQIRKLEKITALAFGQRRKMIRQSLKSFSGLENAVEKAGIKLTDRPEQINPKQFLILSQSL